MLFVFRHGESLTNVNLDKTCKYDLNDDNIVLTQKGVLHALNIANELKTTAILPDKIISSPLARARQTSYLLASTLEHGCPIEIINDFHEIIWHDENGYFFRHEDHGVKNISHYFNNIDARLAPHLENQRDVYMRVIRHMPKIVEQAMSQPIYVVAHYFVVRAIQAYLEVGKPEAMPNFDPANVDPVVYSPHALEESMMRLMSTV